METDKQELKKQIDELHASYSEQIKAIEALNSEKHLDDQIQQSEEIRQVFMDGLKSAKTEVCIISPWVSKKLVKDTYKSCFEELAKNNVVTKIIYGYGDPASTKCLDNKRRLENSREAIKEIKRIYQKLGKDYLLRVLESDTHDKLFIKDNEWYLIGSMNLLSSGIDHQNDNKELAEKRHNSKTVDIYKIMFFKDV